MRILFLESHPMWIHGLPNGFRDLGHQVTTSVPLRKDNIIPQIIGFQPDLVFTMGWTPDNDKFIHQIIIREYLKSTHTPHVYWATEDPTHTERFSWPYIQNIRPDFIFTICPVQAAEYQKRGFRAARLDFGYHSSVHHPAAPNGQYRCTLAVVANAYPNRLMEYPGHYRRQSLRTLIQPILEAGMRIDFWGWGWERMKPFMGVELPAQWLHSYLDYREANQVYSTAAISIGLQNHPTQLTQRTYEILGSGGFLLTSDTPEIRRLFKPGQDLVVAATPGETVSIIHDYLDAPEQRDRIRRQAVTSVVPHSYRRRAEYILKTLEEEGIL